MKKSSTGASAEKGTPISQAEARTNARRSARLSASKGGGSGQRHAELVKIAARRFAEFGFEGTTIREIAKDAHILSGSIYHHFLTKEDILHKIVGDAVRAIHDRSIAILNASYAPESKLVAFIILSLKDLFEDQDTHAILYNERKLFRRHEEFKYVTSARAANYQAWQAVINDGMALGQFRANLDLFLTISTVMRTLNTCADWFRHDNEYDFEGKRQYRLDDIIAFHLDFVLRYVRETGRIAEPVPLGDARRMVENWSTSRDQEEQPSTA